MKESTHYVFISDSRAIYKQQRFCRNAAVLTGVGIAYAFLSAKVIKKQRLEIERLKNTLKSNMKICAKINGNIRNGDCVGDRDQNAIRNI